MPGKNALGTGSIITIALLTAATAKADVAWNEQMHGDLSGDRFNPTSITLGLGVNSITASTAGGDLEYFTISLPATWQLDAIMLASYESTNKTAFIAIQEGSIFTEDPENVNIGNLLGWTHFGPLSDAPVGADLLDNLGSGIGAIGFTPPLLQGDYVFWAQQLEDDPTVWQMDFIVSPSPAGAALLAFAGLLRPRRRSRA